MTRKVFFLHTLSSLIPSFNDLSSELLPGDVEILHIADDMLSRLVLAQGGLSPFIYRRVAEHVIAASQAGASLVQATCSSISPCIEAVRVFVDIPVLKIDEPMAFKAVDLGNRIGVIATAKTTLGPTTDLVRHAAKTRDIQVEISAQLCEGAYDAMLSGDIEHHDEIVLSCLRAQMTRVDVLLLAQASMARVLDRLPAYERSIPILTSPRLAVAHIADLLGTKL
jgi:Asp/Glu/hydantoin racemase